jgi:regulator of sirC expression with transglutaminase-like and TPR domain
MEKTNNMNEELNAMITLLDDSDTEVVSIIESKIKSFGDAVIPHLESAWENHSLNPTLQKKIEFLVHDLQFAKLKSKLINWKENNEDDLLEGLFLLSTYQYPDLKKSQLEKIINEMYLDAWVSIQDLVHPHDIIKVLNHTIFEKYGFEANVKNFHSTSNSMFNLVLQNKKGNPVALCCIYILLAKKLDLPIYGVNLPSLFVLIYNYPGITFYVNAFNKGQIFSRNDIDDYLKQMKLEQEDRYYISCSNVEIIRRILTNLVYSFQKHGEEEKQEEINSLLEILSKP